MNSRAQKPTHIYTPNPNDLIALLSASSAYQPARASPQDVEVDDVAAEVAVIRGKQFCREARRANETERRKHVWDGGQAAGGEREVYSDSTPRQSSDRCSAIVVVESLRLLV